MQIEYALEEGLEMIGTILVLTGCLIELKNVFELATANEFADNMEVVQTIDQNSAENFEKPAEA